MVDSVNIKKNYRRLKQFQPYFKELYYRVIIILITFILSFILCYSFKEQIYGFLLRPLINAFELGQGGRRVIYTHLGEALFTYLTLCFYSTVFVIFPMIIYQVYAFIVPALYKSEKKIIIPMLLLSPILFYISILFVYFIVFPVAWEFFLGFESSINLQINAEEMIIPIELETKISEYLELSLQFVFAFAFVFQTPILLITLTRLKLISVDFLKKNRKYALIIIFIIAAIMTPPDIITQFLIAIPIIILYEISIVFSPKANKERKEEI